MQFGFQYWNIFGMIFNGQSKNACQIKRCVSYILKIVDVDIEAYKNKSVQK